MQAMPFPLRQDPETYLHDGSMRLFPHCSAPHLRADVDSITSRKTECRKPGIPIEIGKSEYKHVPAADDNSGSRQNVGVSLPGLQAVPATSTHVHFTMKEHHMSNEQKVAVITGASQGIGAALVQAYRAAGFRVVAGDIADPETAERIIDAGMQRFGRIDILVNNAGIFTAKPFTKFSTQDWERNISTNLAGFFHITQRAIEKMERQGLGHVVQITTSLADQPVSGVPSVFAALTKGGLNAATKSLAIEYASRRIRVNAVSPDVIKTPMHPPETHAGLTSLHPVGRMGEIQDIVDAVLFLERSGFITGEILHVDGGQSAGR